MAVPVILVGMELIVILVRKFDFFKYFNSSFNYFKGCPFDRYGPDCSYQCPCANCNRFTGVCNCNGTECYQGN